MNDIRRQWIVLFSATLLALILGAPAPGQQVAKVNGTAITEAQLQTMAKRSGAAADGKLRERLLEQAIDNELLYQEAQRQKLTDDEYVQRGLAHAAAAHEARTTAALAEAFENARIGGMHTPDYATVSDAEVNAAYGAAGDKYKGVDEKQAKEIIGRELGRAKHKAKYVEWFRGIAATVPVTVAGKSIPADPIVAAVDDQIPLTEYGSTRPAEDPVWLAVCEAVGIERPPADLAGDDVRAALAPTVTAIRDVTMQVGKTRYSLRQAPALELMLRQPNVRQLRAGHGFTRQVQAWILAEQARRAGFDKDPAFTDILARLSGAQGDRFNRVLPSDSNKSQLIVALLEKEGLVTGKYIRIPDEAIDAFVAKNQAQLTKLSRGSKKQARLAAKRTLQERELLAKRVAYLENLRAAATIEK